MDKLGRYHVQRKVEAANGPIYVASEAGSGRTATLKLVRFTEDTSSDEQARLWRGLYDEVRAAAALQHPNIAQVFEVFQHEGKTYIATEVATDKNLASLLAEGAPVSEKTIVDVLRQSADALDYAHDKGLLHHTVRPSNLGVQPNGTVRVFGFGLAQYFLETQEGSTTADLAYLAPELVRGQALSGRTDQFSLAAIAYEMLTGEAPFQGTAEQIRAGIVEQEPLPADGLKPSIGPEAARVLGRGLAKKPDERYASCREFVAALLQALSKVNGWGASERPSGRPKLAAGGKASVESIGSKSRDARDVNSLMEELVAELAGGPSEKTVPAPSVKPDLPPAERENRESSSAKPAIDDQNSSSPTAERPGSAEQMPKLEAAETKAVASSAAEKKPPEPESNDSRKISILAAVCVLTAIAAGSWLYFVYGFGRGEEPTATVSETPGLAWVTEAVPAAAPGTAYRHVIEARGGAAPLQWAVTEGELPPGLALDAATGTLEGTPLQAGTYAVEITVSDASGQQVTRPFDLSVRLELTVSTPSALPSGVVSQLYQHQIAAEGGSAPYLWQLAAGSLPAGLALKSDGLIVGRPSDSGAFEFEARVADASQASAARRFRLRIGTGLTLLSAAELPSGSAGSPYSHRLSAGGGAPPLRWSVSGGSLPPGVSLDRSGAINGEPGGAGRFNFEVMVRDSAGASAVQAFQLEVQSALQMVTRATLPDANLNRVYSKPLEMRGGNWPYRWSLAGGTIPPGLQLDESSGTIRGTPTIAGNYEFDVQVRDAFQAVTTQRFQLEVTTLLEIQTAYDLPEAVGPAAYRQTMLATGGQPPYLWSVVEGGLPPQFTLDSTSGVLSGVPTVRGEHRFTVEVSDGSGTKANRLFRLSVTPALRFSERGTLPHAIVGERYTQALAVTGGQPPHSWSLQEGALPDGVTLDQSTGVVEGTPPAPGKYRFAVQVADAAESSTRQFFELQVRPPAPGEMVWRGELPKDAVLIIQDGRYASTGTVTGSLPGVPVKIDLEPKEGLTVVSAPARSNNWMVLVINASQPQTEITIRWTPLSSQ